MSGLAGSYLQLINIFSNVSVEYLDRLTEQYFSGGSLLFIYWSDISVDLSEYLVKYWAKSQIVAIETCACDVEPPKVEIVAQSAMNIVVLLGDAIPDGNDIRKVMKCSAWNGNRRIILIVHGDDTEIVKIVLEQIWKYTKAINVAVMLLMTSSVCFYTIYPYQYFIIEELNINNLFPNKIPKDFNGSVLNVATITSEPYVLEPAIPGQYEDGLEIRMLKAIAMKFNMGVQYVTAPPGEDPWVSIDANNEIRGLFGLLGRHEADILFHGVRIRPDRYAIADVITVHTFDELVWVVPLNSYVFNWTSLFVIFQTELWLLIFVFLILTTLTVYWLTKLIVDFTIMDALFQVIAQTLSIPVHYRRDGNLYRAFMIIFSFYTLILVSSYETTLITFLTTPRSGKQYQSVREAVGDDLIAYLYPSGKNGFNKSDHDLWNVILSPGRHVWSEDYPESLKIIAVNKTAFMLDRRNVVEFEIHKHLMDENNEPMVYVIPEKFASYWVGLFAPQGHPLIELFYVNTLRLVESGIFGFWEIDLKMFQGKTRHKVDEDDGGNVKLSLVHLKGAFVIFLVFSGLSLIVFLVEVGYERYSRRRLNGRYRKVGEIFSEHVKAIGSREDRNPGDVQGWRGRSRCYKVQGSD